MFFIEMYWLWLALSWTLVVAWSFIMEGYDEGAKRVSKYMRGIQWAKNLRISRRTKTSQLG